MTIPASSRTSRNCFGESSAARPESRSAPPSSKPRSVAREDRANRGTSLENEPAPTSCIVAEATPSDEPVPTMRGRYEPELPAVVGGDDAAPPARLPRWADPYGSVTGDRHLELVLVRPRPWDLVRVRQRPEIRVTVAPGRDEVLPLAELVPCDRQSERTRVHSLVRMICGPRDRVAHGRPDLLRRPLEH